MYIYYYIEYNYMFRRLIMAIFRLYMNHLVSSFANTHTHTHTYIYIYINYMVERCIYIYIYYYIEYNYMFRRLIMAIFRLYMNHLVSSFTNTHTHTHTHIYIYIYMRYLYGEGGRV